MGKEPDSGGQGTKNRKLEGRLGSAHAPACRGHRQRRPGATAALPAGPGVPPAGCKCVLPPRPTTGVSPGGV